MFQNDAFGTPKAEMNRFGDWTEHSNMLYIDNPVGAGFRSRTRRHKQRIFDFSASVVATPTWMACARLRTTSAATCTTFFSSGSPCLTSTSPTTFTSLGNLTQVCLLSSRVTVPFQFSNLCLRQVHSHHQQEDPRREPVRRAQDQPQRPWYRQRPHVAHRLPRVQQVPLPGLAINPNLADS